MDSKDNNSHKKPQRGWHGDTEGHRRAGRLGGLARQKKLAAKKKKEGS